MIIFIIKYLFLFMTGSLMGWGLEVVYRKYFGKARKWINPGFLSGPYLPLYGTGVCLLYIVSELNVHLGIKIIMFTIITTGIEYFTGLFFLKYYKTRLWDYTKLKFNIQGLIAPLYSVFWTILALVFYFVLYPYFYNKIEFLYGNLEFCLFIGMFYGVILVDVINSFNVVSRLKKFAELAEEKNVVINYEQLKIDIKDKFEELSDRVEEFETDFEKRLNQGMQSLKVKKSRPRFLLPFKGEYELMQRLHEQIEKRVSRKKK
ncbi:putative ABC transporter permease [Oceanirhabdus seepicola]|uniref:ABC transporter permease n=1 Tax=Oceanirhabdus seepicola TaxID=2828781 RepID=A0A9J6NYT2_9CLOT|nr:putative ABC transporter permease [Oceanirhabdus seepicola]MCM1988781.1 putative ABC transporter permease [Oceanirhabdus seepicola]